MAKTAEQIKAEYAPYNKMPAFECGYYDYINSRKSFFGVTNQVAVQAYDRGMEAAMRVARDGK